jgi:hypothetical protein
LELEAPGVERYYMRGVRFRKPDLELPHEDASYKFGFAVARPPEHAATLEVIDHDTKTPLGNAHVLLRPERGYAYGTYTDEGGVARLQIPKGKHELYFSKNCYETFQASVKVADDANLRAELVAALALSDLY